MTSSSRKKDRKLKDEAISYFDFERGGQSYRLYNYRTDLWIECVFDRKLALEELNRWNAGLSAGAVLLEPKDKEAAPKTSVSLESQLDCRGVTDAMTPCEYVNRFEEEAEKFVKTFPK